MLKVENLKKDFGQKTAVNKISFELSRGEVMGFIGPNGAGKSTAMRMITGFLPPTSGSVKVDGHDVESEPMKTKALIGYLPENAPLYSNKSVTEFLELAAELRGFHGGEKKKRVDEAVKKCFLEPVRYQSIDTLSKGYRQRTCFAQAIIHDPALLILDEPTDGLDPNQKHEVRNLIKEMGKNKAIIISTHILEEVDAVTSRVVLISQGEKLFDGSPADFKKHSGDAGTFTLTVAGKDGKELENTLAAAEGVADIEILKTAKNKSSVKFSCRKKSSPDKVREAVAEVAVKKKWEILEFKENQGDLNEVFAQLTRNRK